MCFSEVRLHGSVTFLPLVTAVWLGWQLLRAATPLVQTAGAATCSEYHVVGS